MAHVPEVYQSPRRMRQPWLCWSVVAAVTEEDVDEDEDASEADDGVFRTLTFKYPLPEKGWAVAVGEVLDVVGDGPGYGCGGGFLWADLGRYLIPLRGQLDNGAPSNGLVGMKVSRMMDSLRKGKEGDEEEV